MKEFEIVIHSFQQVREFISTAAVQPFRILVGNENQMVNGKSFIGMVSLDFRRPLKVLCDCDGDSFLDFRQQVAGLLVN